MQNNQPAHPVSLRLLCLLCAVYLLAGLLDHSLWRYEDAVHLGVAWDMAERNHWLMPQIAGIDWHAAPLWYWLAAILGKVFGPLFGFHNAARLATALFGAITLFALGHASGRILASQRIMAANRFDAAAPLLLIGAPGLLLPMHDAQPMIAVLAGHAIAYWGLAALPQRRTGGFLLALGLIVTTLSGGFNALLPLVALLLMPLLFAPWRNIVALQGWLIAAALAMAVIAAIGQFVTLPGLAPFAPQSSLNHLELLTWYAWPAMPVALWPLWLFRRQLGQIALPLVGCIGALIWFFLFSAPHNLQALPLLLPLTLLASTGAGRLRRGAANALDWFGMMTFSLIGILSWLFEAALLTGTPPKMYKSVIRLIPGYADTPSLIAWGGAIVISILWLLIIFNTRRSPWRGTTHWACGVVLVWCLFAALWIPVVDYGKSYAPMTHEIAQQMSSDKNACLASRKLDLVERAALDYHAGILVRRNDEAKACNWLLIVNEPNKTPVVEDGWKLVWDGARPSDRSDRYYLYKR
ncbi:MAG TPA: hypothetical protein VL550_02750 [Rhodocyclaceae bacterium]|jgi:4-amino-4-deoxy-L-arabinose transferase-like glycosyltransferase|nr:hypothetical protein [Rhodocyclaceae bacterium]